MAGRVSVRQYLKLIDGLPDPKGSLSTTIPSAAIASANLVEFGGHTPRYCTSHTASHRPALSSMLTARSLNALTIYGVCIIIIYRVKLFSFNFFIRKKFKENLLDEN